MCTGKAAVIDNKRLLAFSCIKISNGTLVMFANQRFEGVYLSLTKVIHTDANVIPTQRITIGAGSTRQHQS